MTSVRNESCGRSLVVGDLVDYNRSLGYGAGHTALTMPKLAHTKSTKGCKRCKQRKVKVSVYSDWSRRDYACCDSFSVRPSADRVHLSVTNHIPSVVLAKDTMSNVNTENRSGSLQNQNDPDHEAIIRMVTLQAIQTATRHRTVPILRRDAAAIPGLLDRQRHQLTIQHPVVSNQITRHRAPIIHIQHLMSDTGRLECWNYG